METMIKISLAHGFVMCVYHMVTCLPGAKFADAMHYLDNFLDRTGKKAGVVFCFSIKDNGTLGNIANQS